MFLPVCSTNTGQEHSVWSENMPVFRVTATVCCCCCYVTFDPPRLKKTRFARNQEVRRNTALCGERVKKKSLREHVRIERKNGLKKKTGQGVRMINDGGKKGRLYMTATPSPLRPPSHLPSPPPPSLNSCKEPLANFVQKSHHLPDKLYRPLNREACQRRSWRSKNLPRHPQTGWPLGTTLQKKIWPLLKLKLFTAVAFHVCILRRTSYSKGKCARTKSW